jgi:hypothetical protein
VVRPDERALAERARLRSEPAVAAVAAAPAAESPEPAASVAALLILAQAAGLPVWAARLRERAALHWSSLPAAPASSRQPVEMLDAQEPAALVLVADE